MRNFGAGVLMGEAMRTVRRQTESNQAPRSGSGSR